MPIVFPMAYLWGANGVASVQAVADILTLLLAVPLIRATKREIRAAQEAQGVQSAQTEPRRQAS